MSLFFRLLLALIIVLPYTIIGLSIQILLLALRLPGWPFVQRIWCRLLCIVFQVRVTVIGKTAEVLPTLVLGNHVSWLDIPVIGSAHSVSFIAKKEVGEWPFVSFFAALQRTIYVDRSSRIGAEKSARQIGTRLAAGEMIVLFPEGTSGYGTHVLPFKSALVGAVHMALENSGANQIYVQPMTISYTHIQGLPIGRAERTKIAWVGDMELGPHAWELLKTGKIDVTLVFGAPVAVDAQSDRKQLTKDMEEAVRAMLVDVNRHGAKTLDQLSPQPM